VEPVSCRGIARRRHPSLARASGVHQVDIVRGALPFAIGGERDSGTLVSGPGARRRSDSLRVGREREGTHEDDDVTYHCGRAAFRVPLHGGVSFHADLTHAVCTDTEPAR
jgi:hypothetical protein